MQAAWIESGGEAIAVVTQGRAVPRLAYWGPAPAPRPSAMSLALISEAAVPHGGLDGGERFDLAPESGRGFLGRPGLIVARDGVELVTALELTSIEEICAAELKIRLDDPHAGLSLTLHMALDASGVATFQTRLMNAGASPLAVIWLAAASLPLPEDEVMTFAGRWAREFAPARTRLTTGALVQENRTGRTSHHAPPFWVVGERGFGEASGEVFGLHLGWSGDHQGRVERLRDGRVMFQAGEALSLGEIVLEQGDAHDSPVLYAARGEAGLNSLSARFHPFVRGRILGGRLSARPRPVHLNTWEAVYFDQDLAELKSLAQAAAAIGVERFVLDDGWFEGRANDKAALGDWTADRAKYPGGLTPLIDHVEALGMEFGLWVEPEMVNLDSDLARAHPDWILGLPGRDQPVGRGQYVLDLANPDAFEAIAGVLEALLQDRRIAYLKWDMNRDLTHARSAGRPAVHAQTLAVYALLDRLRAGHPGLEIESCASGGGRVDFEILRRTDRIWASDCIDPFDRQAIQRSLGVFLPPELIGAHVGAARAHTTGRWASLGLRAVTALFGAMGVEADVRAMSEDDRAALESWIALYKAWRGLIHGGAMTRVPHADPGCLALIASDGDRTLVSVAQIATPAAALPSPLRLPDLAAGAWTVIRLDETRGWRRRMKAIPAVASGEPVLLSADLLARPGLALPVLQAGDFALFHLERQP